MQPVGTPIWIDLNTDVARAGAFYGEVLGWVLQSMGPDFGGWQQVFAASGEAVGAVGPGDTGGPWQVFLRSDDVDADVARLTEAGCTLTLPAGDVGELGRAAALVDPTGAPVALWQPGTHTGFDGLGAHGTPVWFEINTPDTEALEALYTGVYPLTAEPMEGFNYRVVHGEGRPRFGLFGTDVSWNGKEASWTVYFQVDDADSAAGRVRAAGGEVLQGPIDSPFGRILVCRDPMGTAFELIQGSGQG